MIPSFPLSFYGWVKRIAKQGDKDARRVVGYGGGGRYTRQSMEERVNAARTAGKIDEEWCEFLCDTLNSLQARFTASGAVVDCRDSRDWVSVGDGHMRVPHLGRDEADCDESQERAENVRRFS
jgi:hypothetical protein